MVPVVAGHEFSPMQRAIQLVGHETPPVTAMGSVGSTGPLDQGRMVRNHEVNRCVIDQYQPTAMYS